MEHCEYCNVFIDPSCDCSHYISTEDLGDMTVCDSCWNDYMTFGSDFGAEWRAMHAVGQERKEASA